jgi:hypothetical protein
MPKATKAREILAMVMADLRARADSQTEGKLAVRVSAHRGWPLQRRRGRIIALLCSGKSRKEQSNREKKEGGTVKPLIKVFILVLRHRHSFY